jgi:23S rRNA pseudouridine1911/1915/1917 synthase
MADAEANPLTLRSLVPASAAGRTLLGYLTARFRYHDDAAWRREVEAGRVSLDGRPATGDELLRPGMRVAYEKLHREPPVDDRFTVLHRDAAIVVVDKPAHLPMHADGPFIRNTLISQLRERLGAPALQLVHRLDRETSGVALIACDKAVQARLQGQFADGTIAKTYVAVVHGVVAAPFVANQPIGHATNSAVGLRRSAAADARRAQPARTRFEPIAHGPHATLLRCFPETGRTHQIRVHLEAAGHPVVGDKLYGRPDADYLEFVRRVKAGASVFDASPGRPDRHLLHASETRLVHPHSGEPAAFRAPLPAVFEQWLQRAGA